MGDVPDAPAKISRYFVAMGALVTLHAILTKLGEPLVLSAPARLIMLAALLPFRENPVLARMPAFAVPWVMVCSAVNVLAPRTAAVPVTPDAGSPVPFVKVTAEGVPKLGVVKAGLLVMATLPVPLMA